MYFPCVHCPATLLRGDRGNLAHAIRHVGIDAVAVYLHRLLERNGMSELEAHVTVQAFLSSRRGHPVSEGC